MFVTGVSNIRDVIPFVRPPAATPAITPPTPPLWSARVFPTEANLRAFLLWVSSSLLS